MANARIEAAKILTHIEKDKSYSVLAVSELIRGINFDDERDKSFCVSLVYGVLERKITIDFNISLYLNSGIRKLKGNVLNILRVGAYQILFTKKIPVSAAVNEAVNSAKKTGASYASGMINAVLRKISQNGLKYPDENSYSEYMSVKYSVSEGIFESIFSDYGKETAEKIFEASFGRRPIYIKHNSLKCTEKELIETLGKDNATVKKTEIEGCFEIGNTGDIASLHAYKKGFFYVQDMSSQLCCCLLGVLPGDTVVDCCAAPGGKSFTLAQYLKGSGKIISCDMYEHKTKLIAEGAERLGISNLSCICDDARNLNKSISSADRVLCDVPCSGFGVIGRKPEIRYKKPEEFASLPSVQKAILYSCAGMVKKGGTLIYSTCTLNKKENDDICDGFLRDNPSFSVARDDLYRHYTDKYLTVFPGAEHGDGFFVAKFIKE